MTQFPIDPEEMARRYDEDFIASMDMIGEGAPDFDPYDMYHFGKNVEKEVEAKAGTKVEEQELPETYQ